MTMKCFPDKNDKVRDEEPRLLLLEVRSRDCPGRDTETGVRFRGNDFRFRRDRQQVEQDHRGDDGKACPGKRKKENKPKNFVPLNPVKITESAD